MEDAFLAKAPQLLSVWVGCCRPAVSDSARGDPNHHERAGNSFVISRYTPQWHSPAQPELFFFFFSCKPRRFASSLSQHFPGDRPCRPQTLREPGGASLGEQTSSGVSELPDLRRSRGKVNCRGDGCQLFPTANFRLSFLS